jgi:hypothetical protein
VNLHHYCLKQRYCDQIFSSTAHSHPEVITNAHIEAFADIIRLP